ncbi:MarR family winged helix-turn-helix transcriptional regulator [Agromyces soli]|uniref:MarR family transcriptional regulator n=1 Tax=Agromyces soli TaxID=659012 RepID=A0ABY4ATF7_9MICO|nr:MarR family transcriptional regulator [Agromyces soli]UOE26408.1 MarR family transcriptional regulator [Agromyces soli]
MADSSSSRAGAIAEHAEAMRDFMAHAVLFQDAVARSAGLNGTDLQALGLLLSDGPATPGELAQRTGLTAGGAITTMLDRLERGGFVTRSRDAADRRRVLVSAVPEAVFAEVGPVYGAVAARWNDYLDTLSEEQIRFATEFLARAADFNRDETERLRQGPRARS